MALIVIKELGNVDYIKVCEVTSHAIADILIYQTESTKDAKGRDHLWCFVKSDMEADLEISFVVSRFSADLLICYVSLESMAGWVNMSHPLFGKVGK
jgi:hypothetical protein